MITRFFVSLFILITAILSINSNVSASTFDVASVFSELKKQKEQLPIHVRGEMFLTHIDLEEGSKEVHRHFFHTELDFGKMADREVKWFSRSLTYEILEQCDSHKGLINDLDMNFKYSIRDKFGRLALVVTVDKKECGEFFAFHSK